MCYLRLFNRKPRDSKGAPMLVTFKTEAYANITMFGDVGIEMLKMMGFGAPVPGAIYAEDLPAALKNLESALATMPEHVQPAGEADEGQPAVSLHVRSLPLIELLRAAIVAETHLRWE